MPKIQKNDREQKAIALSARPDESEFADKPENSTWRKPYEDMDEPEFTKWLQLISAQS